MAVPVNSVAPTISGTIRAHDALTGVNGVWDSGVIQDHVWQLASDGAGTGAASTGDIDRTTILDETAAGQFVRYGQTFRNADGTSSYAYSDWVEVADAAYTDIKHYICGTVEEIEIARDAINRDNVGGAIGILPGDYNLKSPYRKALEIDPATATIPSGDTVRQDTYPMYFSSPQVTVYAVVPGSVRLYGEANAIVNSATTGSYSAYRGGMFFTEDEATDFTVWGLEVDGCVPYSATFNVNNYCDKTDLGIDCWDLSHKAFFIKGDNARIIDCDIHDWAGEMIFGGDDSTARRLEIAYCRIHDNQVSATSGCWQMHCHHNEFYSLTGQAMEGLHNRTCRYHDNHFHDISGGGLNILGPVAGLGDPDGWVIDINGNTFENHTSSAFGGVYLSTQTTEDASPGENALIRNNTFRDMRTCISASLATYGSPEQTFCENNLFLQDTNAVMDCIEAKSAGYHNSCFYNNVFMRTQNAIDSGASFDAGGFDTNVHYGTQIAGNLYIDVEPPHDLTAGSGTNASNLIFRDEQYEVINYGSRSISTAPAPYDIAIPRIATGVPISTNIYGLKFSSSVWLRMWTVDEFDVPYYNHGTEINLVGSSSAGLGTAAYLIDGRGCQLKDGEPVILSAYDRVLLKFNANLKLWVEVSRHTPNANTEFKIAHRGLAADIPLFGSLRDTTVDSVNVIDQALWGWKYYETDTNILKIYTDSGWQTVWS